jgi:hypothetical protein
MNLALSDEQLFEPGGGQVPLPTTPQTRTGAAA